MAGVYRPEVEESFFEVTAGTTSLAFGITSFTARDASGSSYTFGRLFGARAYLTRVTDLDGNVTLFEFDANKEDPVWVRYNLLPGTISEFSTDMRLEFGGPYGAAIGPGQVPICG